MYFIKYYIIYRKGGNIVIRYMFQQLDYYSIRNFYSFDDNLVLSNYIFYYIIYRFLLIIDQKRVEQE